MARPLSHGAGKGGNRECLFAKQGSSGRSLLLCAFRRGGPKCAAVGESIVPERGKNYNFYEQI